MQFFHRLFREETVPAPAWNRWLIFYTLLLLVAGLRLTWNSEHFFDIIFYDETEYMYKGLRLSIEQFNNWGPSYNAWYFVLSLYKNDPVALYFFNFKVLITLIPVLLFLFLYVYGVPMFISALFSLSYLMMALHTGNFTQVSHFCLVCLLIGFIAARLANKNEHRIIALFIAAYISMYARQEFLMITAALLLLWVICVIQQRKIYFSAWHVALLLIVAGLFLVFGFISFQGQGIDRSYFAFLQHFYANYVLWSKKAIPLDDFIALDLFKGSKTMFQCMLANPVLFAKHIGTNIGLYGISLFKYLEDFFLPKPVFHYLGKGKHLLFAGICIALAYQLIRKRSYRYISEFVREHAVISIGIFFFFGWSFFSIIMIYPNRHYIVMQFCWYLLIFALLLKNYWPLFNFKIIQACLLILFLAFIPTNDKVGYFHPSSTDRNLQPNLKAINFLLDHQPKHPVKILTPEKGFYAYLPSGYSELFPMKEDINPYIKDKKLDLELFLSEQKIDVIYMNERMQGLIQSAGITSTDIAVHPEKFGYYKQPLDKNLKAFLLIKNGTF